MNTIKSKYPNRKICAIGFSLGAGLLLKYLGEEGENCPRSSVVAISPSFDFHVRGSQFIKFEKLGMLNSLIKLVQTHKHYLENHSNSYLDWNGMINSKTIRDFDQAAIVGCPPNKSKERYAMESSGSPDKLTGKSNQKDFLHYASVDDYYTASSCKYYTHLITIPTLTINAEDDPISTSLTVPTKLEQIGKGVVCLRVANGSHVSFSDNFFSGKKHIYGPASCWMDRVATAWLSTSTSTSTGTNASDDSMPNVNTNIKDREEY